jgi:hypothetical protein
MLIGSSGRFETRFAPDECAQRLNQDRSAAWYVGYANASGFQLAKYGRTMVLIRGTFIPSSTGSGVDYRVEFIPWLLWALALSVVISILVLIVLLWIGHGSTSQLGWSIVIVPLALAANLWISERQAQWLRDYVTSALEARPDQDLDEQGLKVSQEPRH